MNKIIQICIKLNQGVKINLPYILVKNDRLVLIFLKKLFREGYLNGVEIFNSKYIKIMLKYNHLLTPAFKEIKILSKPTNHLYVKAKTLTKILKLDTLFLFTLKGVLTGEDGARFRVGGKLICSIF